MIAGYHRDDAGDWVAELACGHGQHVRHRPPFQLRTWVLEEEGRRARLGTPLECPLCDDDPGQDRRVAGAVDDAAVDASDEGGAALAAREEPDGGERVCYAALVCPDCGAVMGDAHPERPCGR